MAIEQPAWRAGHPIAPVLPGVKGNNIRSSPEGWPSVIPKKINSKRIIKQEVTPP